jgi:hypothetical protein
MKRQLSFPGRGAAIGPHEGRFYDVRHAHAFFVLHMQELASTYASGDQKRPMTLLAARTIIFRLITKGFVRFASVALIAAMVQVSLISLPSAQTISAQTPLEAQILIKKIDELKNLGRYAEAIPARAVTRTSRSSATGSIDNSPGGFFLH